MPTRTNLAPPTTATRATRGMAFPFGAGPLGLPQPVSGERLIQDAVRCLLTTGRGERRMRPEMGTNAQAFLFGTPTPLMLARLAADVAEALRAEPRITVIRVTPRVAATGEGGANTVIVDILYAVGGQVQGQQVEINGATLAGALGG